MSIKRSQHKIRKKYKQIVIEVLIFILGIGNKVYNVLNQPSFGSSEKETYCL